MSEWIDFLNIYIEGSIEMCIMLCFFSKFLGRKAKHIHYFIFNVLGIVSLILFSRNSLIQFLVFILMLTAAGLVFYKSRYDLVILYAIVIIEIMRLCFGIFDSLSGIVSPLFFPINPEAAALVFMIAGNVSALSLSVFCYHIVRRFLVYDAAVKARYALMILTPTLMIFLFSEYISTAIYGNSIWVDKSGKILSANHYQMFFIQFLGIASLFCIMYAYKRLLDTFLLNMKISLLEQESHSLRQYVEEAQMRYEKTKSFRHDVKNHISIIRELLKDNQSVQALAYIGEMENLSVDISFPCNTNHPVLNVLLANKLGIAKNNGVDVSCFLNVPYPCRISDMDFCIVLSNALDNAISANESITNDTAKFIRVTGNSQGDFLLIEIQNSFQQSGPLKEGTGLKNIRTVAEKYQGTMSVQTQGNVFTLSVLLIIPQQPETISQQTD